MKKRDDLSVMDYTRFFRALSDPTRIKIMVLLTKGELCVCQIEAALKVHQAKISRHLAYLRKHEIVSVRSQWKWKHYSLFKPQGKFEKDILRSLRECLANNSFSKSYFAQRKQCVSRNIGRVTKI